MKKIMFNDKYGLTKAVLEGRKTQTRRIINLKDHDKEYLDTAFDWDFREMVVSDDYAKYKVGEVVAIAQSYKDIFSAFSQHHNPQLNICVKNPTDTAGWSNKMFVKAEVMPHQIRITKVRIERLQDISDEDCLKEGIIKYTKDRTVFKYDLSDGFEMFSWKDMKRSPREAYAALIDKVGKKGDWESNPYVFVYDFELINDEKHIKLYDHETDINE